MASADELDRLDRQLSDLPLEMVVRFDQLADEFESALRAGGAPDPAEFVARLDADEQAALGKSAADVQSSIAKLKL